MTRIILVFLFTLWLLSCDGPNGSGIKKGHWLAQLETLDNKKLPFNFKLDQLEDGKYTMSLYNADEIIKVDEITLKKDSIIIQLPVYEGYIAGTFSEESITGVFVKESLDREVPFTATYGIEERFAQGGTPLHNITGDWETEFSPNSQNSYMAKGMFKQIDDKVTGTFRTATGDYRYLEGVLQGDSLKLSSFDGANSYLFMAKVSDSAMKGEFYSGNHFKESFLAKRNENFELPSGDELTFLKKGYERLEFSFPDASGKMVSMGDPQFKDKVVIVQIMGTWCPNCLDETKFLVEYLKDNRHKGVSVVALAFEYAKTQEAAFKSIKRLEDRIGVEYPILLAQYASSDKSLAEDKLPMLNHVLSYPTTIVVDRQGKVRKIHTGFNGPATGSNYLSFKKDFYLFIDQLLAE